MERNGFITVIRFSLSLCSVVFATIATKNISDIIQNEAVIDLVTEFHESCPLTELCRLEIKPSFNSTESPYTMPCCEACSCDRDCDVTFSCCPDIIKQLRQLNTSELTDTTGIHYTTCVQMQYRPDKDSKHFDEPYYKIAARCPLKVGDKQDDVNMRCTREYKNFDFSEHVSGFMPVIDRTTMNVYKNKYCYQCNSEESAMINLLPFVTTLMCANDRLIIMNDIRDIEDVSNRFPTCNVIFLLPTFTRDSGLKMEHCTDLIDQCNVTGNWDLNDVSLERKCRSYTSVYKGYKNIHCAMCNGVNIFETFCEAENIKISEFFTAEIDALGLFSQEESKEQNTNHVCPEYSEFNPITKLCEMFGRCPVFMYLHSNGECRPFYTSTSKFNFAISFRLYPKVFMDINDAFVMEFNNTVNNYLTNLIDDLKHNAVSMKFYYAIHVKTNLTLDEAMSSSVIATEHVAIVFIEVRVQILSSNIRNMDLHMNKIITIYQNLVNDQEKFDQESVGRHEELIKDAQFYSTEAFIFLPAIVQEKIGYNNAFMYLDPKDNFIILVLQELNRLGSVVFLTPLQYCPQVVISNNHFFRNISIDGGGIKLTVDGYTVSNDNVVFTRNYDKMIMCKKHFDFINERKSTFNSNITFTPIETQPPTTAGATTQAYDGNACLTTPAHGRIISSTTPSQGGNASSSWFSTDDAFITITILSICLFLAFVFTCLVMFKKKRQSHQRARTV